MKPALAPRFVRLLLLLAALVAVALVARAVWLRPSDNAATAAADSTGVGMRSAMLWFASADGDSLVAEPRELPEAGTLHARVAACIAALEQGPRLGGVRTLPAGTRLLHAYLDESGLLTLDLSRDLRQGFRGGARAEELAIGSLVRTVSAGVPEGRRLRIVCAGSPLASLGGHIPLDRPLDPADWP